MSLSTPLGARSTGGFCFAPTGSVARVASHQVSNHAVGLTSSTARGGIPRMPRCRTTSREALRYAPAPLNGGGALRCHSGAYSTSLLTLSLLLIVYPAMIAVPHDQPTRFSFEIPRRRILRWGRIHRRRPRGAAIAAYVDEI